MDKDELKEELATLGRELLLAILSTAAAVLVRAAMQRIQYGSLLNQPPSTYRRPVRKEYIFDDEDDDEPPFIKW